MKLSGLLYFIIKLVIIAMSVVILVYLSKTKTIKDSKSEIKDTIEEAYTGTDTKKLQNIPYVTYLLLFYDILVQSNITAIITIILFFGGMALTYFTKIKIRIKFIIKLIMIGLLISFIIIASNIDYILNYELYDSKDKKFTTIGKRIYNLTGENNSENMKLAKNMQNLNRMLNVCRICGYISFSLMLFLLVTEIYK